MARRTARRRNRLSFRSLPSLRSELRQVFESLEAALKKSRDVTEKADILFQTDAVRKRLERVERAIASIRRLQVRKRKHQAAMEAIGARIKRIVRRQSNAGSRWLHRWHRA